jgi:hypothetical protein
LTEYPAKKLFYDNELVRPSDVWLDKRDYNLGDVEIEGNAEMNRHGFNRHLRVI